MKYLLGLGTLLLCTCVWAQDNTVVGRWKTVDDETGEIKSVVEIYQENNKLYGKVEKVFPREGRDPNPVCKKCTGALKDQKIQGMTIIDGLSWDGKAWSDGKILDPAKGKLYDCKLWLDSNDKLKVRGYVGIFFRTQTWLRM